VREFTDEEVIVREYLLAVERAGTNVFDFLEFVMRGEEEPEKRVVLPDHQRLALEFALWHPRGSVSMLPVGHGKTFLASGILLHKLGQQPNLRCGVVSSAEGQAKRPLSLVKDYVEHSKELGVVFPKLRRSTRPADPWTDTSITIDRSYGIKSPSLIARGLESRQLRGGDLDFIVIDDVLNAENCATPEQREKVHARIQSEVLTRIRRADGGFVVINTAVHPDDAVQKMIAPPMSLPAIVMAIDGTIRILNAPTFDSDLIVPVTDLPHENPSAIYRLVRHGEAPLWADRWPQDRVDALRTSMLPEVFAQNYMNVPLSDSASLCKHAYVDRGKAVATALGIEGFAKSKGTVRVSDTSGNGFVGTDVRVFTGVDLAVSKASHADETAIFTFAVFPGAVRVPLRIDHGHWSATEIEERLYQHIDAYLPVAVAIENVGAQELFRQGVERRVASRPNAHCPPIKPYTTDKKKHDPFFGLPQLFSELANGLWAVPNDRGMVHPSVQKWIDQMVGYHPSDHTGDILMAMFFASELAKKYGALARTTVDPRNRAGIASILKSR